MEATNTSPMTFIERYRAAKASISPARQFVLDVCQAAKVKEQTARQWLCGAQTPSEQSKELLAIHFGVSVDELFPLNN